MVLTSEMREDVVKEMEGKKQMKGSIPINYWN